MDKIRVKGKLINMDDTESAKRFLIDNYVNAEIELSSQELVEQLTFEEVREIVKWHKSTPQEVCTCKEPQEYTERNSATGDKVYTGQCIKCLKPLASQQPLNEKYGIEINGKWIPLSKLPSDINELNKLIQQPKKIEPLEVDNKDDVLYRVLAKKLNELINHINQK